MAIVVFGYGAVGKATTEALCKAGRAVVVAQRSEPAALPSGASFKRCDVLDAEAVRAVAAGADQIVAAIGFAYEGHVWKRDWPRAMANLLGDIWVAGTPDFAAACALPELKVHLYGKAQAKPGRKMGHLTALADTPDEALARVRRGRDALRRVDSSLA